MVLETYTYFRYFKKNFFKINKFNYLILYVTSRCNSFCKTCFFYKRLNKNDDLSLDEFKKISKNLGNISILLLSGGEPFLRKDLEELCCVFIENNKIDNLLIPTNGILTVEIMRVAENLLKKFPKTIISINPSLDGMEQYHDAVRGVENNFNQTITTIKELEKLKKIYNNLQIIVNSVINNDNLCDLKNLIINLSNFNLDRHAFELLRGEYKDKNLRIPDFAQIKHLHKIIVKSRKSRINNIFEKIIVIGSLKYIHKIKESYLLGKNWPFRCAAGKTILVIYPNGDVSLCELKEPIGNLRENNYDINTMFLSERALKEINCVDDEKCSCTHTCFLNVSIAKKWSSIFKILYYYFRND